tara:strand:- start:8349 stop:9659 length:1311 start_codon:yes stop_codon:yes gene_type:complete
MAKHLLKALEVKNTQPAENGKKRYLKDGGGLFLQVSPSGAKSWIFRRRDSSGKVPEVGLGSFSEVGLGKAREIAGEIWKLTSAGVTTKVARDTALGNMQMVVIEEAGLPDPNLLTFEKAATEFIDSKIEPEARNEKHVQQWRRTIKQYVNPHIGHLPLDDIELSHALEVLQPIWNTKTETAKRTRQRCERVLDWGRVMGHRTTGENPFRWKGYLDNVLPSPNKIKKVKHMPSMPHAEVPAFLKRLQDKPGMGAKALHFAILCASRSGEVRGATWYEIDLDNALWTIPGPRMKGGKEHKVPLSGAAVDLLKTLPDDTEVVFPAPRKGNALSDMTLTKVMRDMEIKGAVVHGFRSSFKDWCRESGSARYKDKEGNLLPFADEISELALAHVNSDQTRAAYARSDLLELRRELMEAWAAYLTPTEDDEKVVPITKALTN